MRGKSISFAIKRYAIKALIGNTKLHANQADVFRALLALQCDGRYGGEKPQLALNGRLSRGRLHQLSISPLIN